MMASTTRGRRAPKATPVDPEASSDPFDNYDILIANGMVDDRLFSDLLGCSLKNKKHAKVVLCLVTYGGQANAGYRIGRFLQQVYDEVVIFVPSYCKSAGTLVATAGNRLVMSVFGEIGPLDVQLVERDELGERKSGLTIRSALEDLKGHSFDVFQHFMLEIKQNSGNTISFKLAAELAAGITTGLMDPVYQQIHPDVLGKDFRDLSVATKYGDRLNKKFNNLKPNALKRLVHDYPSHDFVIDAEEAKELFDRVESPSPRLYALTTEHRQDMMVPKTKTPVVRMVTWEPAVALNDAAGGDDVESAGNDAGKQAPPHLVANAG